MKLFLTLAGIVTIVLASWYFLDSGSHRDSCSAEPLPSCAWTEQSGSYVTVTNGCDYDITVQWSFLAGRSQFHDLAPGAEKTMSSFPVKVKSVSCCSSHNRCW